MPGKGEGTFLQRGPFSPSPDPIPSLKTFVWGHAGRGGPLD